MRILGIETSCDETAAAVLDEDLHVLSSVIESSIDLHRDFGGVVPELAGRAHVATIGPVVERALRDAGLDTHAPAIDAIAVTSGPGLIGSLLIGVETAKTIALATGKPLIPVNQVLAHMFANFIGNQKIEFPAISLVVSGGHTELFLMESPKKLSWLGGTLDDAAGEAFDKTAKLLGLDYPGGPAVSKLANQGKKGRFKLPRPMLNSGDLNFSFSGLKTAVLTLANQNGNDLQTKADIAYEFQEESIEQD